MTAESPEEIARRIADEGLPCCGSMTEAESCEEAATGPTSGYHRSHLTKYAHFPECPANWRDSLIPEIVAAIRAERTRTERAIDAMLGIRMALQREGWEKGLTDEEAVDRLICELFNLDADEGSEREADVLRVKEWRSLREQLADCRAKAFREALEEAARVADHPGEQFHRGTALGIADRIRTLRGGSRR